MTMLYFIILLLWWCGNMNEWLWLFHFTLNLCCFIYYPRPFLDSLMMMMTIDEGENVVRRAWFAVCLFVCYCFYACWFLMAVFDCHLFCHFCIFLVVRVPSFLASMVTLVVIFRIGIFLWIVQIYSFPVVLCKDRPGFALMVCILSQLFPRPGMLLQSDIAVRCVCYPWAVCCF